MSETLSLEQRKPDSSPKDTEAEQRNPDSSPRAAEPAIPFVGPRPFEDADAHLFFGRNREVSDIVSLIVSNSALLLYSPSGAGKTSLLKARVSRELESEDVRVLPIARVQGAVPPTIDNEHEIHNIFVLNVLLDLEPGTNPESLFSRSLSDFLKSKASQLAEGDLLVLVIDQFEELFTSYEHRAADRTSFMWDLATAMKDLPQLRVVLSMREDYIAGLDRYLAKMPDRLRARYRLERLQEKAALDAVIGPVKSTNRTFDDGVPEAIVKELLKTQVSDLRGKVTSVQGEFVEPVQLQVVCQNLWISVPPSEKLITHDHLKTFGNIDQVLRKYYDETISEIAHSDIAKRRRISEAKIREWFGRTLITQAGTRGNVFQGEKETGGLSNDIVTALERQRLIRREMRASGQWYEVTHDRLLRPVQDSNREWFRDRANARNRMLGLGAGIAASAVVAVLVSMWEYDFRESQLLSNSMKLANEASAVVETEPQLSLVLALAALPSRLDAPSRPIADGPLGIVSEAMDALRNGTIVMRGHESAVYTAAYSKDGTRIVTASRDGTLRIWDADSHKEMMVLRSSVDEVTRVARTGQSRTTGSRNAEVASASFSPDGTRVVTASPDRRARLWDVSQRDAGTAPDGSSSREAPVRRELRAFDHPDEVRSAAFNSDGSRIVTASADGFARIWDASTGEMVKEFKAHSGEVLWAAFSPNGTRIVTASDDNTARIWDAVTGTSIGLELKGHNDYVRSAAFSPDGTRIVTGSDDNTARIWDAGTGMPIGDPFEGHDDYVRSAAFSSDGTKIVTASDDRTVRVWDVGSGSLIGSPLTGHNNYVRSAAFSPNNTHIVSSSDDGTIRIWDVAKIGSLPQSDGPSVVLSQTGEPVHSATFSPDGTRVVTASADGNVRIFDAATRLMVREFRANDGGEVLWAAFSPDGAAVVTASDDNTAGIWNADTGMPIGVPLNGHQGNVRFASFSPDGTRIVTASDDKTARIWDAKTGLPIGRPLEGHEDFVRSATFSPDGTQIATASDDNTVRIWNSATGLMVREMRGHSDYVRSAVFSPDGRLIVTASEDQTARVWDAQKGGEISVLKGHEDYVTSAVFSPDGASIVTASQDRTARVWNASTAAEITVLRGHADYVNTAVFSPDGTTALTASEDGTVRMWSRQSCQTLVDAAAKLKMDLGRNLTEVEQNRYGLDSNGRNASAPFFYSIMRSVAWAATFISGGRPTPLIC